jgi:methylglutaconyl-CoA hydratase
MKQESVLTESGGKGIVVLTLNRPGKRNALNLEMMEELCRRLEEQAGDDSVRVVILRGSGPAFCAGLDLEEASLPELAERSADRVARTLRAVSDSPKVLLAAAHGAAVAGGAGLLLACDVVVAAEDLRVGFPEVRRGLVAALVMAYARRRLRELEARELLLSGESIGADHALRMGLVNRVVAVERLMTEARELARAVTLGAPEAVRVTKSFLGALWPVPMEDDLRRALELHQSVRLGEEAREGARAFLEKRVPRWAAGGDGNTLKEE